MNTFSATATDVAGNVGTGTTSFTLVVDLAGMDAVIDRFAPGLLYDSLLKQKAADIAAAGPAGKARARQQFAQMVAQAQASGALTAAQAATLNKLAGAL